MKTKPQTGRRWSAKEDKAITAKRRPTDVVLSKRLNRTVGAISGRRSYLRSIGKYWD